MSRRQEPKKKKPSEFIDFVLTRQGLCLGVGTVWAHYLFLMEVTMSLKGRKQ